MQENPLLTNKNEIKSEVINEKLLNLLDKTFVIPTNFTYSILDVTDEYTARMDLVSKVFYGTEKYSDILCKLNGISNPFELNSGALLVIPDIDSIKFFYYKELPEELEPDSNKINERPIAKAKNEKRKPNEAVVGDKRYKVDSTRKVIVY